MTHRAHHLYNLIRWICEEKGQCTASRETLARAIGDSPKSLRLISEALQELAAENLIEIEEREMAPNLITLNEHHDSYYGTLLLDEFTSALNQRDTEEMIGDDIEPVDVKERDKKTIEETNAAFSDDDFGVEDV